MRRPSYASTTATLALVVALGGTGAYAAGLAKNSVGSPQIKNNSVKSVDVKDGSLLAKDFKAGQLPAGAQGPAGAAAFRAFARIGYSAALPSVLASTGGVSVVSIGTGISNVTFPVGTVNASTCAFALSVDANDGNGLIRKSSGVSSNNVIQVRTFDDDGSAADRGYNIVAFC